MSKNNIIRVQKNKENPYVMINKDCINDSNLTWAAKGLHTYLLSLPDNWTIYVSELVNHTSAGRDHTYTVIRELISFGYMQRFEYRYKGRVVESSYVVYETPISVGPLTKSMATIVKVTIDENGEYVPVEDNDENIDNTTTEPNTESTYSVKADSDNTKLLNNNIINNNKNNNDLDEDDVSKIIDLFKTFKLEKRVLPHTTKLLKDNTHISIEVFNEIFIAASGDDVKKKYQYLKETIKSLNDNTVITIGDYENYCNKYKESKNKPVATKGSSSVKTRFHNINQTFTKYGAEELESKLQENQKTKFEDKTVEEVTPTNSKNTSDDSWEWNPPANVGV